MPEVPKTCLDFYHILEVVLGKLVAMARDGGQSHNTNIARNFLKFERIVDDKTVVDKSAVEVIYDIVLRVRG